MISSNYDKFTQNTAENDLKLVKFSESIGSGNLFTPTSNFDSST